MAATQRRQRRAAATQRQCYAPITAMARSESMNAGRWIASVHQYADSTLSDPDYTAIRLAKPPGRITDAYHSVRNVREKPSSARSTELGITERSTGWSPGLRV